MRNQDIRNLIRSANVRNYEVAEALGVSDNTFYMLLRKNLTSEDKQKILGAIESVKKEH